MRRGRSEVPPRSPWRDEAGLLATPVLLLVWYGFIVAIAVVDVGAYLVAAGRAQAAADAAALAAVSLDVEPASTAPVVAARTVAHRNRGDLESCRCRLGSGRAEVEVSVAVHGLFIPRVTGAQRVTATAQAELADVGPLGARHSPPWRVAVVVGSGPLARRGYGRRAAPAGRQCSSFVAPSSQGDPSASGRLTRWLTHEQVRGLREVESRGPEASQIRTLEPPTVG